MASFSAANRFSLSFLSADLGAGVSSESRPALAVCLLHPQHISILSLAITYPYRPLLRYSQALNDQSQPDIGTGQP